MTITTPRVRLTPFAPADLLALLESEGRFAEAFGFPAAPGLREFFSSGDVSPQWLARLRAAASEPADPWTYGFGVVHPDGGSVIGSVGFKGPPDADGTVEVAYGIVPDFRGNGYATEAASAAVEFAFATGRVSVVRAHTLPTPNASTRVLAKCGFQHVGEVVDPEDGLVWRWERRAER
jgi:[ribosomal protein S5]-alanine N-acetyltransferase